MESQYKVHVGVFDSGIGGLTVLKECVRLLPQVEFYYLSDHYRAPYGNRPKEEILRFTREAMEIFRGLNTAAVVLACNTATAVCAETLRMEYPFPIVGIEPAVKLAAERCAHVLVLATARTAESDRLKNLTERFAQCRFEIHAAPRLAELIERKVLYGKNFSLKEQLPKGDYDGVVLGCTHYVFLKDEIAKYYGVPVFDGNFGTALHLARLLEAKKIPQIGTDYHQIPPAKHKQMYGKLKYKTRNGIIFLGKAAKLNQKAFFLNICFKKI